MKIAIVGAGITGSFCAKVLNTSGHHHHRIVVFEKSRGAGGRMAQRHSTQGQVICHGAQYFTQRTSILQRFWREWAHMGLVTPWRGPFAVWDDTSLRKEKDDAPVRWVSQGGTNGLCKALLNSITLITEWPVEMVTRSDQGGWRIRSKNGEFWGEDFDVVIFTAPAPQVSPWVQDYRPDWYEKLSSVRYAPTWAAWVECSSSDENVLPWGGVFMNTIGPLSWVAHNGSRPGLEVCSKGIWTLHASQNWSEIHIEDDAESVQKQLCEAFREFLLQVSPAKSIQVNALGVHRWRYATPLRSLETSFLWDPTLQIGVCGDGCGALRIEGALESALALCESIVQTELRS